MTSQNLITFQSGTQGAHVHKVTKLDGSEGISQLYRFELWLVSQTLNTDDLAVLANDAKLSIKQGMGGSNYRTIVINGRVCEWEQMEKTNSWANYRAVVVPRMWTLTKNVTSRVFLDLSVQQIVAAILTEHGLAEGTDFAFSLSGSYPTRDYVVQYEESDFAFISRLLEHEGIFFFFEQTAHEEKAWFADSSAAYKAVVGAPTPAYNPASQISAELSDNAAADDWFATEVVARFNRKTRISPKTVQLKDYNWKNTSDALEASADINQLQGARDAANGVGIHREMYNNYTTVADGTRLATARAYEHITQEATYNGVSDCRSFSPGFTFTLSSHYRADFNVEYVLTSVRHRATQQVSLSGDTEGESSSGTYANTFTCMLSTVRYCPPRVTPRPKIAGVVHGVVESTDGSNNPMMNSYGQFKVRLKFDSKQADKANGAASCWLRMSSPTAGGAYGTYTPLRGGTEVLIAHLNGDPDRPFIIGAVPNATNRALVDSNNPRQTIVQTVDGTRIVLEDDNSGLVMHNGRANHVSAIRNGNAGTLSGAGYVAAPSSFTPGASAPTRTGSVDTPVAPLTGIDGGFGGAPVSESQLNSRVGIFSGPMAQMSLDGGSMSPEWLHRDDDMPGGAGVATVSAEDLFFNAGHGTKATLDRGFQKGGPGAVIACDDAVNGSDFRATAGHFEASDTKYIYICGNSLEVYDMTGARGVYQKGGNYNFYYDNVQGAHSTYINADTLNNEFHLNGNNLVMNVKQADTGGDQVWGPGASECVCFERQYNITDLTGALPRDVNSSALPAGKIKEELIAKEVESHTTVTAGTGKIEEHTTAKDIYGYTHANNFLFERTTCGLNINTQTQAVGIAEHTACVGHAEHFACVMHAETFEGGSVGLFIGAKTEISVAAILEIALAAATEIFIGNKLDICLGNGLELVCGNYASIKMGAANVELNLATKTEMDATTKTEITAAVNTAVTPMKKIMAAFNTFGTP